MHFANCLLSRNSTTLNQAMAESYPCFDQWQVHLGIFFSIRLLALNQLHSVEKNTGREERKKLTFHDSTLLSSTAELTKMQIHVVI